MRKNGIVVRLVGIFAIIYILVVPLTTNQYSNVSAENKPKENYHRLSSIGESQAKKIYTDARKEEITLTHEELVTVTEKFMDLLVQKTDSNYRVIDYDSKTSLLKDFQSISEIEVAKPYVDYYYEENDVDLYIVPTETPPWFEKNQNYEMIYKEGNKVVITQENESELYGEYKIVLELTYDDKWRLTEISHL